MHTRDLALLSSEEEGILDAISKTSTPPPPPPPATPQSFRFFDLPAEVRLRIYELCLTHPTTIDLDPLNNRRLAPRHNLFLVSQRMHAEAYRVFYGSNTFRLFPLHGRFFHTKRPLLTRLPPRYRAAVTALELRLGPGFTGLPRCWNISPDGEAGRYALGLADLARCRRVDVFVECDPASDDTYRGFRRSEDYFTRVCAGLLQSLLVMVPAVADVQFDGWPSVKRDSPLMKELLRVVREKGLRVMWGPERGWGEDKLDEVEAALARLTLLRSGKSHL